MWEFGGKYAISDPHVLTLPIPHWEWSLGKRNDYVMILKVGRVTVTKLQL